jgi:hypothetical protein
MSAAFDLTQDGAEAAEADAPKVFSRVFAVPPGAPWEQSKAAQLEARHGSPLPISDLTWRLRRLGGWGPGAVGRFVVFYVRSRELVGAFETTVEVEGRPLHVAFGSTGAQLRQAQRLGVLGLLTALLFAAVIGSLVIGLGTRTRAEEQLTELERTAEVKYRQAMKLQQRLAQERELRSAVVHSGRLEDVIADLAWASAAKAPEARIAAFHWDHGFMAVEARGESPPLIAADRQIERAARPLRPGVWLWGVKPAAGATGDRQVGP